MTYDDLIPAIYETQREAAAAIGVSKQAISLWRSKGIPLEYQIKFEVATEGRARANLPDSVRAA